MVAFAEREKRVSPFVGPAPLGASGYTQGKRALRVSALPSQRVGDAGLRGLG
jgi:hypothetical protein